MKNALSVDLEDYYHATAFSASPARASASKVGGRVEANTERALSIFAAAGAHATFFTVGDVAERYPRLIRTIAEQGHEIGCHSYAHRLVYSLTPEQFREDTRRAKLALEDASGTPVRGYRAPTFSITPKCPWAFEILAELGFTYDSSIFPIRHLDHGMPAGPRFPFSISTAAGPIAEFPMPTLALGSYRAPFGGGAYMRILPYWYTRWALLDFNNRESRPACVYVHPWELDPEQPRMSGSVTAKLRQYTGLRGLEKKLVRLLRDFEFLPIGLILSSLKLKTVELFASKRIPERVEPVSVA
ncbi:MAG TPA: XrtA system polysaccharide deacetylase [Candidatus Acidoferrales bacterium]|nr:XrtA system polysaccharide deacetylase [Candidatus Acidoferrales bacterium]